MREIISLFTFAALFFAAGQNCFAQESLKDIQRGTFPVPDGKAKEQKQNFIAPPKRGNPHKDGPIYTRPPYETSRPVIFIEEAPPQNKDWAFEALGLKKHSKRKHSLNGAGVNAAIFDSGVSPHSQLSSANISVIDVTGADNTKDLFGHGTAVAGIIAAAASGEDVPKSCAPQVKLMSYKVTDERGLTNTLLLQSAVDLLLEYNARYPQQKITVLNISYGLDSADETLEKTLRRAYDAGVFITAPSGNNPQRQPVYPAGYDFVVSVGAIRESLQIEPQSNYSSVDFIAPGGGLLALDNKNGYQWVKGTSFSSAYVAGIAILITQAYKEKYGADPAPQQVLAVLKEISSPLKSVPAGKQGFGLPDASKIRRAVKNLDKDAK